MAAEQGPALGGRISRRSLLRAMGAGAVVLAADGLRSPARATPERRPTVAVYGGGVSGLTAAHELAERGFDVSVFERRAWGGKVRSTAVPASATGGRRPLPSELGFQAEFGAFHNLPDTMRRIPFGSNPNGVFDNLSALPQVLVARDGKHNLTLPFGSGASTATSPEQVLDLLVGLLVEMQLPPAAAEHFANRLGAFMSSCEARRIGQWERTTWVDFVSADGFGEDYYNFIGRFPEFIQGVKAEDAGAKYPALVFESFLIYPLLGRGTTGSVFSTLNAPSDEAWINPWTAHLQNLGVSTELHHELIGFRLRDGRIHHAVLDTPSGRRSVTADWHICALPVERARALWDPTLLAADPGLARMHHLPITAAGGVNFYLRKPAGFVEGVLDCIDSPWALSAVPQASAWSSDFSSTFGDGRAHDRLSVIIATWDRPGPSGATATDCTPDRLAADTWEQIKRHLNKDGREAMLRDDMLASWSLDPSIVMHDGRLVGEDPLVLPSVDTEQYRPDVRTGIPNLILCGDYLNGRWEVANLEAACFNGRRAANAILDGANSSEEPAATVEPYRPPEWEPFKATDERRYRAGQPNVFDLAPGLAPVHDLPVAP